ncbi:hypothetical protein K435DRAFT_776937 [Dendrothele bispora CBS 962.96]|uniref:DUF6699 domain-containing protein n=1 Tax=Dendrothele bispora (strain CBS 962.96) TaxID=1314807 RepID=A0A4S8MC06_DENBC|nr:hypothetical protein K435DRAFT_776937 [Dendrothele bispora CBS 962.96]
MSHRRYPTSSPHAPYSYMIPLPPQTSTFSPRTHPYLEYSVQNWMYALDFDLNITPALLWQQMWDTDSLVSKYKAEPATTPGVPSMSIVHPELPWCITVHASGICGSSVAVADVITTVCKMLQLQLTANDLSAIANPNFAWVSSRRLDLLNGRTRLIGLQKTSLGGEIYEMIIL